MIVKSIIRQKIGNVIGDMNSKKKVIPPIPGDFVDAILLENGQPLLLENGNYFQLETSMTNNKTK